MSPISRRCSYRKFGSFSVNDTAELDSAVSDTAESGSAVSMILWNGSANISAKSKRYSKILQCINKGPDGLISCKMGVQIFMTMSL